MEGEQPYLAGLLTMVINHLLAGMILQVLLMEEILHHWGCKNGVNNGIDYLSTGAGYQLYVLDNHRRHRDEGTMEEETVESEAASRTLIESWCVVLGFSGA